VFRKPRPQFPFCQKGRKNEKKEKRKKKTKKPKQTGGFIGKKKKRKRTRKKFCPEKNSPPLARPGKKKKVGFLGETQVPKPKKNFSNGKRKKGKTPNTTAPPKTEGRHPKFHRCQGWKRWGLSRLEIILKKVCGQSGVGPLLGPNGVKGGDVGKNNLSVGIFFNFLKELLPPFLGCGGCCLLGCGVFVWFVVWFLGGKSPPPKTVPIEKGRGLFLTAPTKKRFEKPTPLGCASG